MNSLTICFKGFVFTAAEIVSFLFVFEGNFHHTFNSSTNKAIYLEINMKYFKYTVYILSI